MDSNRQTNLSFRTNPNVKEIVEDYKIFMQAQERDQIDSQSPKIVDEDEEFFKVEKATPTNSVDSSVFSKKSNSENPISKDDVKHFLQKTEIGSAPVNELDYYHDPSRESHY